MNKSKKKNLNSNLSATYLLITFSFLVVSALFLTSNMYMEEDIPIKHTELFVPQRSNVNGDVAIESWIYDSKKNEMKVVIQARSIESFDNTVDFEAISRVQPTRQLATNVLYKNEGFYVVNIKGIPSQFEQVALRLITVNNENKEDKQLSNVLYTDQRQTEQGVIEDKNATQYAIELADNMTGKLEKDIAMLEETNVSLTKSIETVTKSIADKEEDKIYQTAEDQLYTNSEIEKMRRDIVELERRVSENENVILNHRDRIEKLVQKKNDLKIGI